MIRMARKQVGFTLSTKARNVVIRLKKKHKASKSEIVEALLLGYERFGMPHEALQLYLDEIEETKDTSKKRPK
jgi:hypothetical protein